MSEKNRYVSIIGTTAVAMMLSGCIVGGMMSDKSEVVIDPTSVDPALRAYLPTAKRLAFMSTEQAAIYAAEHMEMNSDLQVSLVTPPEAASPSQAKRYMEEVCKGSEDPEVVFYFRQGTTDAGTGTTVKGVITGRAMFDINIITEALQCDNNYRSRFMTTGKINSGVYNVDATRMDQILGQKFSAAILQLAGKPVAL